MVQTWWCQRTKEGDGLLGRMHRRKWDTCLWFSLDEEGEFFVSFQVGLTGLANSIEALALYSFHRNFVKFPILFFLFKLLSCFPRFNNLNLIVWTQHERLLSLSLLHFFKEIYGKRCFYNEKAFNSEVLSVSSSMTLYDIIISLFPTKVIVSGFLIGWRSCKEDADWSDAG